MEFRPFWEMLGELGIALPNPSKIKGKRQGKGFGDTPARVISLGTRSRPRDADEMFEFLEAMLAEGAAAEEEIADDQDWISPGETVRVAGYKIPGMVYVGENLTAIRNYGVEPCLIRPTLRVSRKGADYEKQPKSYSLSYTQMQTDGRAAYLRWLSEGRCAPKVYSGYVWLFFYGLERRVLHDLLKADLKTDAAKRRELDQIIAEVARLKDLYGDPTSNWSFGNKVEAFLEICRLLRSQANPQAAPIESAIDPLKAQPFALQVGLGQKVKQGQPIPADWALAWYTRLANNALPVAATRCPEEFKTLFQLRYTQEYGTGIKLKPGKVKLKTTYYPSNPSFGRTIEVNVGDLPDISRFTAKLTQIGDLVQKCRVELEPLSRLLSRNPDARNTPAAIALLPSELVATHGGEVLKKLQQWLDKLFAKAAPQTVVISGKALFQHWSSSNPEKLTKSEATGLSQLLAMLGYGMEPDPRFGGALPTLKSDLVLFRLPSGSTSDPANSLSAAYGEATLWVQLAIATASGDEIPSPLEQQYMQSQLGAIVPLKASEQARLNAYLQRLLQEKPTLRNLKARIEPLKPARREAIAQFLVQVAAADGQIKPKEVQLLEKAYTQLGLDPQTLYSDIHNFSTVSPRAAAAQSAVRAAGATGSEPVTVRQAVPTRGRKIPGASASAAPSASKTRKTPQQKAGIDMALVQSKLEESKEISDLLEKIFVEESPPAKAAPAADKKPAKQTRKKSNAAKSTAPSVRAVAGLDGSHSELLHALAKQNLWQRAELTAIATDLNLMLDGALEVINEVAFDRHDEAVVEGDDPIEVNADVLRELLA